MMRGDMPGLSRPSNQLLYDTILFLDNLSAKQATTWGNPPSSDAAGAAGPASKFRPGDRRFVGKERCRGHALICGDFAEVYSQIETWVSGAPGNKGISAVRTEPITRDEQEYNAHRCAVRAQKNVRRLVNCNRLNTMWTLTFAPDTPDNQERWECVPLYVQRDYDRVRAIWKSFLKRLARVYPEVRWLVVFELHNSEETSDAKRGTWHLHFATSDFLDWSEISRIWKHGVVRFDDFSKPNHNKGRPGSVHNPGAYMSKYIGKVFDSSNYKRKRFSRSRNTSSPKKISLDAFVSQYLPGSQEIFCNKRIVDTPKGLCVSINRSYRLKEGAF